MDGFSEGVKCLQNRNHKPKYQQTGPNLECTTPTVQSKQEPEKLEYVRRRMQKAHRTKPGTENVLRKRSEEQGKKVRTMEKMALPQE